MNPEQQKSIEQIVNDWTSDLEKHVKLFTKQAVEVARWDRQVLEYMGDLADYVSLHRYVGNRENRTADFLAVTNSIDRQIEEMDATCRFVHAKCRTRKRAYLCFDEWNVWYKNMQMDGEGKPAGILLWYKGIQ